MDGSAQRTLLITLTGRDRPGVTSRLFRTLSQFPLTVADVEQVVIRGRLVLGVQLTLRGDPGPLRKSVLHAATVLGMEIDVAIGEGTDDALGARPDRHHVIVIGRPLRAGAVGELSRRLAEVGGNIDTIRKLSHYPVTSLELMVSGADAMQELLDRRVAFDAVVAFTDSLAFGALHTLAAHGIRVPDDVLLTGFDDVELSAFTTPSLTTIAFDRDALASAALSLLTARMDDRTMPPRAVTLPHRLHPRGSTAGSPGGYRP